jgi:hypothetical protein
MISEWDKNSAGNIRLTPLFSFEVAPLLGTGIGLRLELVQNRDQPQKDLAVVQLGMTVEQTKNLIEVLHLQIDALLAARPLGPTN